MQKKIKKVKNKIWTTSTSTAHTTKKTDLLGAHKGPWGECILRLHLWQERQQ